MKDEHNLDKLFKEGLDEVDIPFREEDWTEMSKKLDQQDKKTVFPLWWALAASAAASVLIFFVFFNAPKNNNSAGRIEKKPFNTNAPKVIPPVNVPMDSVARNQEAISQPLAVAPVRKKTTKITDSSIRVLAPVAPSVTLGNEAHQLIALATAKTDRTPLADLTTKQSKPTEKEMNQLIVPQRLSFTVLAAPDISSTSTSVGNKVSTNLGVMLSYALTRRIGLSTGVIYAKKVYNYNGLGVVVPGYVGTEWRVDADCKVLDLPLNVDYNIFKKRKLAVNVSAGLSSYIMLNEKYQLTNSPGLPATNEEVTGNKHFLGIANFSVSVERQVNSRLSLGLQPFVKLPLTGIGKYEGNLSSAGLSVLFHIKSFGGNN